MIPEGQEGADRRALGICWRALSRRDHTFSELRAVLERRGVEHEVAEAALAEIAGLGYLDDAAYARRFVEDRRRLDRWGEERIVRELQGRGVVEEDIEAALEGRDAGDELDAACLLLAERMPEAPADDRARRRALGLLVRRGYEAGVAYEAVRRHEREGRAAVGGA